MAITVSGSTATPSQLDSIRSGLAVPRIVDHDANETTASYAAGTLLRNPTTGLIYGQADGSGSYQLLSPDFVESGEWVSPQFGTAQMALPTDTVRVTATGLVFYGACALAGVHCITVGTGTLTIHDDTAASDATKLRFTKADSAMSAGTYYPAVYDGPAAMLFDTGMYVTIPSSGVYVLDVVTGLELPGVLGSGLLCATTRVAASGLTLTGPTTVVGAQVLAAGSSGSFAYYDDVVGTDATRLIHPTVAYNASGVLDAIRFGPRGGGRRVNHLYVTVPTSGVVLVHYVPR